MSHEVDFRGKPRAGTEFGFTIPAYVDELDVPEEDRESVRQIRRAGTHLLNLMSADPALRHLPYWESLEPIPAEAVAPGKKDPRIARCAQAESAQHPLVRLAAVAMQAMARDPDRRYASAAALSLSTPGLSVTVSFGVAALGSEDPLAYLESQLHGSDPTALILSYAGSIVPPGDEQAWTHPPFAAEIANGQMYGRGAVDMKGGIACSVAAVLEYLAANGGKPKGSISFLITGDETTQKSLSTFVGAFLYAIVGVTAINAGYYGAEGRAVVFVITLGERIVADLRRGEYKLPQRVKRVAQKLVSLAEEDARLESETALRLTSDMIAAGVTFLGPVLMLLILSSVVIGLIAFGLRKRL